MAKLTPKQIQDRNNARHAAQLKRAQDRVAWFKNIAQRAQQNYRGSGLDPTVAALIAGPPDGEDANDATAGGINWGLWASIITVAGAGWWAYDRWIKR